jgi:hypothetical protein
MLRLRRSEAVVANENQTGDTHHCNNSELLHPRSISYLLFNSGLLCSLNALPDSHVCSVSDGPMLDFV